MSKKLKIASCKNPFVTTGTTTENLSKLKTTLESLLNLTEPFDYQGNYRSVYSLIHSKMGDELYTLVTSSIESFILYKSKPSSSDTSLPDHLCSLWEHFKASLKAICGLLSYTENTYFRETMKPGFYIFSITLFKSHIFVQGKIAENIKDWLIKESFKNKTGTVFEKDILKSIIGMLVEIGLGSCQVYCEVFEGMYLEESYKFYKHEAEEKVAELQISEYLQLISFRLKQEIDFCQTVLSNTSQNAIVRIIYETFVEGHMEEIFSNEFLLDMIRKKDFATLAKLYEILCEKGSYVNKLKDEVKKAIRTLINEILSNENTKKKPLAVVDEIFNFLEIFENIKNKCFRRNQTLETEANLALEISLNPSSLVSVYFAVYLDNFLKKHARTLSESDLEQRLQKSFNLFQFIRDKDVFESKHREFLAQRLLDKKFENSDIENTIIKFMKQECGLKFVSKAQGMINDMLTSNMLDSEVFCVQVLTASHWPQEKFLHVTIPDSLSQYCAESLKKYCSLHTGRTLIYRLDYGSCILTMNCTKKYTLIGSMYQGCILLMFNTKNSFPLRELLTSIAGTEKEIKKHLLGLVKSKVLLKCSKGKVLLESDVLSVNDGFVSSLNRITLEVVSFENEEVKEKGVGKGVEDDRKFFIEASVVKVMKARRTLEHKILVAEVMKFCVGRFTPDLRMIKERIEGLIVKEFLARDKDQNDVYHYIT